MANEAGHDINYLAHAGVMGLFGPADGPPGVPGVPGPPAPRAPPRRLNSTIPWRSAVLSPSHRLLQPLHPGTG